MSRGHYLIRQPPLPISMGAEMKKQPLLGYYFGDPHQCWHVWYRNRWRTEDMVIEQLCPYLTTTSPTEDMVKIESKNLVDFYRAIL